MGNYKIEVKVKLVECEDAETSEPMDQGGGDFSMVIGEEDAVSIDRCENALLETVWPSIRGALSSHLSEISKKKTLEACNSGEVVDNPRPYKVDGEAGRFEFTTHGVLGQGRSCYNSACDLFPGLKTNEFYRTTGFKEIGMIFGDTKESYRKTAQLINRVRHQEKDGTPHRTLQENTEKEGAEILDFLAEKTRLTLCENGFSEDGRYLGDSDEKKDVEAVRLPKDVVSKAAEKHGDRFSPEEILDNPVLYEDRRESVELQIDDVVTKKQKEDREKVSSDEERKRKYNHITIAHVRKGDRAYTFNGENIRSVLCFITAFILNNNLLGNRLQIFTDGHRVLNSTILKYFSWFKNIGIILDWYHLGKKCKECLSLALKGRFLRKEVLSEVMPLLWFGLTDRAIEALEAIDSEKVKNKDYIEKLIAYLDRNRPYIPCYALRKDLGLCNSSALGEKMNDLIVSNRQKHNGMSWSKKGSVALATITTIKRNNEHKKWFEDKDLDFKLAA